MISLESIEKCGFELIEKAAGRAVFRGQVPDFQNSFSRSKKTITIIIKAPITGDSVILESAQVTTEDQTPVPIIWEKEMLESTLINKLRALDSAAQGRSRFENEEKAARKPDFSDVIFHLESAAIAYQEAFREFSKKPEPMELTTIAISTFDQFFKKQPKSHA